MRLALFDLDHTLLDGDSNTLWIEFLIRHGHVPPTVRTRQAEYMAHYAAETLDIVDYFGFHLGLLAGRPLADWLPVRSAFVTAWIAPRISAAARAAVAAHRRRGDRTAIVTATHSFLSEAIGALFDVPVIAPQAEVDGDRLTGRIAGPICFRAHKIACVEHWLQHQGRQAASLDDSHFYSDSINDLPLLEAVTNPVAVNPDARLIEIAMQRGWPIAVWRCAQRSASRSAVAG